MKTSSANMPIEMDNGISKYAYAIIVVLIILLSFLLVYNTTLYDSLSREDNIAEYFSALFLLFSSILFLKAFLVLVFGRNFYDKWIIFLLSFLTIIFFIGAGEEISWGQRIFNLKTPEYLLQFNDQNELNFHNIDKKFFDRLLDRITIIFVFVGSILFLLNKQKILKIKSPNLYIICCFAITPFYRQSTNLDFYHALYIPLILILAYTLIKKLYTHLLPIILTLMTTLSIQIFHSKFEYLFPLHNNSVNEFKEFMFCFCVLIYSYEIMKELIKEEKVIIETD